ncbi:esterase-like activity of phytase family protein [Sphingosinicella sp. LHD-64]|uniref:esterase-like activity of phytase family protein n=1 Tax=Sphingosinicella sp. LHD-64 TaxID=3072139 RepID=UPI0028109AD4|nr:esterase-like activity of phytase family protein [Sphingosinicella sp. LHD-64]MDQ8756456.1 esterase-like activity of phytase family protein [Sphingosinicella sp. LHD-64]
MPKSGRLLFLLAAFFALTTIVEPAPPPPRAARVEGRLTAEPVALDPGDPARGRVGALIYRRGWVLRSDAPRFGGLSAMHVENGAVTAISDVGDVLRFRLPGTGDTGRVAITALPVPYGSPLRKRNRDTEAVAVAGGEAWVSFERNNLIARYRRSDWRLEAFQRPEAMRRWGGNSGAEAMVRLPDGRFILFAEGGGTASRVLLYAGDPAMAGTRSVEARYRRPTGYRPTDAALLPDSRLMILNRRVDWPVRLSAKLVIADLPAWRAGAVIEGREVATLEAPLTVDNMEALSVARENGRTIVRIASDDNFMRVQRTLLLEFELLPERAPQLRRQ